MYRFLRVLVFFVILQIFVINVDAKVYECEYQFSGSEQKWTIEYDTEKSSFVNKSEKEDKVGWVTFVYSYEYNFLENEIKSYEDKVSDDKNFCPVLYVAENSIVGQGTNSYTYKVYSDSFLATNMDSECYANKDQVCFKNFFGAFSYFYTLTMTSSEVNKENEEGSICPSYDLLKKNIESSYKSYSICKEKSCINYLNTANSQIDKLKRFCNLVFQYRDIKIENGEKDKIDDACVGHCLKLSSELDAIKIKYGISTTGTGECGFSARLMSFISNILRWIKYILPIIVIVLGILDFIKAIGADKDDEIKKAQGKFIKRLIAAALVFIIPLIIEFILDKMGFGYDDCGLF